MDDIIVNQWTRMPDDCVVYDAVGNEVGMLRKTYGIKILEIGNEIGSEIGNEFVKVFSPDLNRNVYIRSADLKRI